jgi:hypothetical protein
MSSLSRLRGFGAGRDHRVPCRSERLPHPPVGTSMSTSSRTGRDYGSVVSARRKGYSASSSSVGRRFASSRSATSSGKRSA